VAALKRSIEGARVAVAMHCKEVADEPPDEMIFEVATNARNWDSIDGIKMSPDAVTTVQAVKKRS
jgi:hypothetical protein